MVNTFNYNVLEIIIGYMFRSTQQPSTGVESSPGPAPTPQSPPEGTKEGNNEPTAPTEGEYDEVPDEQPDWKG